MNYAQWVKNVFDHEPLNEFDLDWPEETCLALSEVPEREKLRFVTILFEDSQESLKDYSDVQTALGLKSLTGELEDSIRGIYNVRFPIEERLEAVRSIYSLFRDCLDRRCENCRSDDSDNQLNLYCYMFWDASQIYLGGFVQNIHDPFEYRLQLIETMIDVLENTLNLPSIACQEAALHGLGHSRIDASIYLEKANQKKTIRRIQSIIDRYLETVLYTDPLREYAQQAKSGGCFL